MKKNDFLTPMYYRAVEIFHNHHFDLLEFAKFIAKEKGCKKIFKMKTEDFYDGISTEEPMVVDYVRKISKDFLNKLNSLGNRIEPKKGTIDETGIFILDHNGNEVEICLCNGFPGNKDLEIIPADSMFTFFHDKKSKKWTCTRVMDHAKNIAQGKRKTGINKITTRAVAVVKANQKKRNSILRMSASMEVELTPELRETINHIHRIEQGVIEANAKFLEETEAQLDIEGQLSLAIAVEEKFQIAQKENRKLRERVLELEDSLNEN